MVSGSNIKTINGMSILGNGNITISGGEGSSLGDFSVSATAKKASSVGAGVTVIGNEMKFSFNIP